MVRLISSLIIHNLIRKILEMQLPKKQQNKPSTILNGCALTLPQIRITKDDSMVEETLNEGSDIDSSTKENSRLQEPLNAFELSKVQKMHYYSNLRELTLRNNQLSWKEVQNLIEEKNFPKNLQNLDISENYLQDKGVWILMTSKVDWESLESLNLGSNHFEKIGIRLLSSNLALKGLKRLDLSKNPIGNEGVKFIAESTHWTQLEVLSLNNVSINDLGIKHLASNESWKNLQELSLQDNPFNSNLGAVWLSSNTSWTKLRKLVLSNPSLGDLGAEFLRRNKLWRRRSLFCSEDSEITMDKANYYESNQLLRKKFKGMPAYDFSCGKLKHLKRSNYDTTVMHWDGVQTRGGNGGQVTNSKETKKETLLGLIEKIKQYKMKVQDDKNLENQLKKYVEMNAKFYVDSKDSDSKAFEVTYGVNKHLLSSESKLRVLLLTGGAGIGKTLFCKYLQREMLFEWDSSHPDSEERPWLPIVIDLSRFTHSSKSSVTASTAAIPITLADILSQELSLTEAEIDLLRESQSDADLSQIPQLLFILDEYDELLQKLAPSELCSSASCIKHNFYMANEFASTWGHAKIIITCRNETFSHHTRRDLLFGPVDQSTSMPIQSSFVEFVLQPFDGQQIALYLQKCAALNELELPFEDVLEPISALEDAPPSLMSESWYIARKYENAIYHLDLGRFSLLPLTLPILLKSLPHILEEMKNIFSRSSLRSEIIEYIRPKVTYLQLYHTFVNQSIEEAVEKFLSSKNLPQEEQNGYLQHLLSRKLRRQLENLALSLDNYDVNQEEEKEAKLEDPAENALLLSSCPLLKNDNTSTDKPIAFSHRSFKTFFIAQKIKEEILKTANPVEMIINQKPLMNGSVSTSVVHFLADAVIDQSLPAEYLLKLINKTKQVSEAFQDEQKSEGSLIPQENQVPSDPQQQHHHPLSIVAANAITILNVSGFKFSKMNLSKIDIPGANLSHGTFEGTDFTGANLQGVNFSEAWLQDTCFVNARMDLVTFGVIPDLMIDKKASSMTHSPDGNYIAVGTRSEVIVLKKQVVPEIHYKEVRRMKGHAGDVRSCSFNMNGKLLVTGAEDRTVRIWNMKTGECLHTLRGHTSSVIGCEISQDGCHIISVAQDQIVTKWSLTGNTWTLSYQFRSEGATNCGFVPNSNQLLFVGNKSYGWKLYHSVTGKYIRKGLIGIPNSSSFYERPGVIYSNISSTGKQLMMGNDNGTIHVADSIRGLLSKSRRHECIEFFEEFGYHTLDIQNVIPSFCFDDRLIISTNAGSLLLQEICKRRITFTNGSNLVLPEYQFQVHRYSFDPISNQIVLARPYSIHWISHTAQNSNSSITGPNNIGLNLTRTNIDDSQGLSDETAMIFEQRGDYKGFDVKKIRELIFENRKSDLDKILEIDLSNSGIEDATVLARNSKWTNLEILNLSKNCITDNGASAIAQNFSWRNLRKLDLNSNCIGYLGAASLAMKSKWENLEVLNLSRNQIGESGAVSIGCNTSWKCLKSLDLSSNGFGDQGTQVISINKTWHNLEELNLSYNHIGYSGAAGIGLNTIWSNLRILSLDETLIGSSGASAIVRNDTWVNLEELYLFRKPHGLLQPVNLSPNKSWEKIKIMIFDVLNPHIQNVLKFYEAGRRGGVHLSSRGIQDSDTIVIARYLSDIGELWLDGNQIGDKGAEAIGKNKTWTSLKSLRLGKNRIQDEGAFWIGKNQVWIHLEELRLSQNQIGDKGAIEIGSNPAWVELKLLWLDGNEIGDKGAEAIGKNAHWSKLKQLYLNNNKIGDEGAAWIGSNPTWVKLEELHLSGNEIGNKGAEALEKHNVWSRLKYLFLSNNKIGDEGAIWIGLNTTWIDLEVLRLDGNEIGDLGAEAIGSNTAWKKLRTFSIHSNKNLKVISKEALKSNPIFGSFVIY